MSQEILNPETTVSSVTPVIASAPNPEFEKAFHILCEKMQENFNANANVSIFTTSVTTDVSHVNLYELFRFKLPEKYKQYYNCNCCRKFFENYASLVTINSQGETKSLLWTENDYGYLTETVNHIKSLVEKLLVDGVFISSEKLLGIPKTGKWNHFAITTSFKKQNVLSTDFQLMAEKKEDFKILKRSCSEFNLELVNVAIAILNSEKLQSYEKCLGIAKWFSELLNKLKTNNKKLKDNLIWKAVAEAPPGWTHIRNTMIGTLLEDLEKELPFEEVKRRFNDKMHPLKYQRPTTISDGNIASAEKIIEKLGCASSLERRFARFEEVPKIWIPRKEDENKTPKGIFDHLKSESKNTKKEIIINDVTKITWNKFKTSVLPGAKKIEYYASKQLRLYSAILTAKNEDNIPIFQWDSLEQRNPFSWYVYTNGSTPENWNLASNNWHNVTGIIKSPHQFYDEENKYPHHGEAILLLLNNCKDNIKRNRDNCGNCLFPSTLKSEFHSIRSTIESFSKTASIYGYEESTACGVIFNKSGDRNTNGYKLKVTNDQGIIMIYELDRWE